VVRGEKERDSRKRALEKLEKRASKPNKNIAAASRIFL
jgi:hypothetical protein